MPGADIRARIAHLVAAVQPFDAREAADQRDVLRWIASGQELFRTMPPATPPKHLVVYFVPVDATNRCLLLGDHRKSGLWLPPGGHVEDGEDPRQAVIREAREELGMDAEFRQGQDPLFLTVTPTKGPASHLDVSLWFVLRSSKHDARLAPDPREFRDARWFDLAGQDIAGQESWPVDACDPEMHRFAAKLRSALSDGSPEHIQAASGCSEPYN